MRADTIAKAARVLELYDKGTGQEDIALTLKISRHTIRALVKMHGRALRPGGRPKKAASEMRIPVLGPDQVEWLDEEATRLNVSRGALMKAMLVDAIEEAKNG